MADGITQDHPGLSATQARERLERDGPNELPRARRRTPFRIVIEVLREQNFGLIDIDWAQGPRITLQIRDVSGRVRIEHALDAGELRPRAGERNRLPGRG